MGNYSFRCDHMPSTSSHTRFGGIKHSSKVAKIQLTYFAKINNNCLLMLFHKNVLTKVKSILPELAL
jgi:hypothetical protein